MCVCGDVVAMIRAQEQRETMLFAAHASQEEDAATTNSQAAI
jgi:hypothetical protein